MGHEVTDSELQLIKQVSKKPTSNRVSSSAFFNKNPDLFTISPRPGGFLRLLVPSRSQDFTDFSGKCMNSSCPTVFQHNNEYKALSNYPSDSAVISDNNPGFKRIVCTEPQNYNPPEISEENSEFCNNKIFPISVTPIDCPNYQRSSSKLDVKSAKVLEQSMEMLAVTISCIMQMAAKIDVPSDTLSCAETYLRCMKDQQGRYPRNILGILSEIKKSLTAKNGEVYNPREEKKWTVKREDSKSSIGSSIFNSSTTPERNYGTSEKGVSFDLK